MSNVTCPSGQCDVWGTCETPPDWTSILGTGGACFIQKADVVVKAAFHPINTVEMLWRKVMTFLSDYVHMVETWLTTITVITSILVFIYISSWIGSIYAFLMIFI